MRPPRTAGSSSKVMPFDPALVFLRTGDTAEPTPGMKVKLSAAAPADTVVDLTYGDPSIVSGPPVVTIPQGMIEASLVLTAGLAQPDPVLVTATFGNTMASAQVRVYGPDEVPQLVSLLPAQLDLMPGGQGILTVTLDLPASAGGVIVALAVSPADAALIPASVSVPEGQLASSFAVVASNVVGDAEVFATLDADLAVTKLSVCCSP